MSSHHNCLSCHRKNNYNSFVVDGIIKDINTTITSVNYKHNIILDTITTFGLATSNDEDIVDSSEAASIDRHDDYSSWQDDVWDDTQVKHWRKEQVGSNLPPDIRKLELELAIKQAALELKKLKIEADKQQALINQETELKLVKMKIEADELRAKLKQETELKKCVMEAKNKEELELERMKLEADELRAKLEQETELKKCEMEAKNKQKLELEKLKIDADELRTKLHHDTELKKCQLEAKTKQDQLKRELETEKNRQFEMEPSENQANYQLSKDTAAAAYKDLAIAYMTRKNRHPYNNVQYEWFDTAEFRHVEVVHEKMVKMSNILLDNL